MNEEKASARIYIGESGIQTIYTVLHRQSLGIRLCWTKQIRAYPIFSHLGLPLKIAFGTLTILDNPFMLLNIDHQRPELIQCEGSDLCNEFGLRRAYLQAAPHLRIRVRKGKRTVSSNLAESAATSRCHISSRRHTKTRFLDTWQDLAIAAQFCGTRVVHAEVSALTQQSSKLKKEACTAEPGKTRGATGY